MSEDNLHAEANLEAHHRRESDARGPAHRIEERHAPSGEVRTAQLNILARFALYSGGTQAICAVVFAILERNSLSTMLLLAWLALIIGATYGSARWLSTSTMVRRSDQQPASRIWMAAGDCAARAALWISMPVYATLSGAPINQATTGGLVAIMIVSGISVAVIPAAIALWVGILSLGMAFAAFTALGSAALPAIAILAAFSGAALVGFLLLARSWQGQMDKAAVVSAKHADIRLLLQEYEDRGAGWLWQIDRDYALTYVSPRMGELLGCATYQLLGRPFVAAFGGRVGLGDVLGKQQKFGKFEIQVGHDKEERWVSLSGSPIFTDHGEFMGYRGVGLDITDSKSSHARLQHLANLDVLTSLPNRSRVRTLLETALVDAKARNVPCAVLFLDLDGFKPVNDTFGHPKGDAVLKTVARRLHDLVGQRGTVGRIGGDEFAVVLDDAQSRVAVESLAEKLIATISEPYMIDNIQIRIGLSIGCAYGPVDGDTVDDLVRKADLALYHAKSQGRGTFCNFDAKMQVEAEERVRLEHDMRDAIGTEQFNLLYQPLVSTQTQRVTGFEALLRWNHPTRGPISPAVFIPIAEESGLVGELGDWVMRKACMDAAHWPDDITVAVNVSPLQLVIPSLPNDVADALKKARLSANRLEIEVTESVFMSGAGNALDVLKRLRSLGSGIALDDFGTGYSSLGYLNKAVFHKLKIDGSFVREAAEREETVSIIKAIVMLANSFRLTITAEGIETADDFNRMRELGCHQLQGYLFGRPMPLEKTLEIVGSKWEHRQVG
ncbi:putative bifunctional diguanylate cyclase/phosphodiesterase [Parasphingopyxis marina]|uniref:EAL domain-containing protein n=1 Tax=Parasphingopyxis marina TaxID=2761622 RepID=A0A842HXF3_9SPHN|nr:EAL domain-containing protein [Parasphingopyxis marina]MBC2777107.1 EAL domain-containing protein [Parasphingopyxis marina]